MQAEEIEALESIYGDDFIIENDVTTSFSVKVLERKKEAIIFVRMPAGYPNDAPPSFELSAPWMARDAKENLTRLLNEIYS